jgi:DegV family protein with EDD domain
MALLAIDAAEQIAQGKSADEIFERAQTRVPGVQTSFIVDKLDYLHKGGRCSTLTLLGANLLKIKPTIVMKDGKLTVGKKFRGKLWSTVDAYVDHILDTFDTPDNTRVFVTHTEIEPEIVDAVKNRLKERSSFAEILETTAGSTITAHCGKGTLGILYFNDGGKA